MFLLVKHIDIRHPHIRGLKHPGWLDLKFVKSENNASDIPNKNVGLKLHTKHTAAIWNRQLGRMLCARVTSVLLMVTMVTSDAGRLLAELRSKATAS